jgi:type IV pilus assembly protein PilC
MDETADIAERRRSYRRLRRNRTAQVAPPPRGARPKRSRRERLNAIMAIELTPKKVKREEVMNFARQSSAFVRAGIPLIDALGIIAEDTTDKKLRDVLAAVTTELRGGSSLSDALSAHSTSFPKYFLSMVRSAEMTGQLDEVLDQLAVYIGRDLETRRRVKSAMTYPSVIFVMAIATIVILSLFVLPKFQDFFKSFDAELPWATQALVSFTDFMTSWGGMLMLLALWLIMAGALATRRERGKLARDKIFLNLPRVGMLLRTASIERFCHIMAVMVRAGVPLPDALSVASDTTGNRVFRRGIAQIRSAIIRGSDMAGPIAETALFPAAARQMIRVGEATGTLEEQLAASADYFGRELEYKLKRFTDLFEPMIVAFMGLVVGFVAYALVSAMYGIFNQVNG